MIKNVSPNVLGAPRMSYDALFVYIAAIIVHGQKYVLQGNNLCDKSLQLTIYGLMVSLLRLPSFIGYLVVVLYIAFSKQY